MINSDVARTITPADRARALLELLRLPNVFTAMADVMLGYIVVMGVFVPYLPLALLMAASCGFYLGGMVLNDFFDRHIDAEERPYRPIPSGRISAQAALVLGLVLLAGGVMCGWLVTQLAEGPGHLGPLWVSVALAAAVLLYDGVLARTVLAPLGMGLCRFLNVGLGLSMMFEWPITMHYVLAGGVAVYVMGVTLFSRGEADISRRPQLIFASILMLAGMAMLAVTPQFATGAYEWRVKGMPSGWNYFWLLIGLHLMWRNGRAISVPNAKNVQAAVKNGIMSIIVLDAAASMPFASIGMFSAMFILVLIVPANFLGRWLYST